MSPGGTTRTARQRTGSVHATIGIVAGEASGDRLGAGLMRALHRRHGGLRFVGIGGAAMLGEGLESMGSLETLAVNGFRDPLVKLPGILGLLAKLRRRLLSAPPDVFVGVDFNVFNLWLERVLKARGVPTVHYVSPSVYAWRRGRAQRIGRSADRLLALFPFDRAHYAGTDVEVVFVGHPLADAIDPNADQEADRQAARRKLGLAEDGPVVALLPGSRDGEIRLMLETFLEAAGILVDSLAGVAFVIPCPTPSVAATVRARLAQRPRLPCSVHVGDGCLPLTACDAALVKSGTGTLEAMLLRRPMVVTYRLGPLAWSLARRLVDTDFVALPNLLAGRALVPELLQDAATPAALAENLLSELDKFTRHPDHLLAFSVLHGELRRNASERAAEAVAGLLPGATESGI